METFNPHDYFNEDVTLEEINMILEELPEVDFLDWQGTGLYPYTNHGFNVDGVGLIGIWDSTGHFAYSEVLRIKAYMEQFDKDGNRRENAG